MARVRKAPTTTPEAESSKPEASPVATSRRVKLPRFGIVGRVLGTVLRPLRWLVPSYFVNAWREVRQVTWPSRRETWRLTLAVFIFAIVFGSLVAVVDKGLDFIFKNVILK